MVAVRVERRHRFPRPAVAPFILHRVIREPLLSRRRPGDRPRTVGGLAVRLEIPGASCQGPCIQAVGSARGVLRAPRLSLREPHRRKGIASEKRVFEPGRWSCPAARTRGTIQRKRSARDCRLPSPEGLEPPLQIHPCMS